MRHANRIEYVVTTDYDEQRFKTMRRALSYARHEQPRLLSNYPEEEVEIQRWIYRFTDQPWPRLLFDGCYRLMPDGRLLNFNQVARSYSKDLGLQ